MRLSKEAYNYHKVKCCENCKHFETGYDWYFEGTCDALHDTVFGDGVCDVHESDEEEKCPS